MVNLNPRIRTLFSLGLTVFAIVILLACGSGAATETGSTPTSAPRTTVAASPTPKKTPTPVPPTPTPTPFAPTNGPTVIGEAITNFFGKYGGADVKTNTGYTWFLFDSSGNRLKWINATYQPATEMVIKVSVVNASDTNWSLDQSLQECRAFLPDGATFEQDVEPGIQRYHSYYGDIQLQNLNDIGDCTVFIL